MSPVFTKFIQSLYDQVMDGMNVQKVPAYNGGRCKYRMDGLKCAIGHLIPDSKYKETFESLAPTELLFRGYDIFTDGLTNIYHNELSELERVQVRFFLDTLQLSHDMAAHAVGEDEFLEEFKNRVKRAMLLNVYYKGVEL